MTTPPVPVRPTPAASTRHVRRLRPGTLLALGALALGAAACSSSSSPSTTTAAAPPTTAATATTGGSSASSSSTASTSTTTAGTPACRTTSLAITLGAPNGSAGATHYGLTFQNTGSSRCTLYGYPGVSFLDSSGTQIGDAAQRQGGSPTTVTLAAGGSAYASVAVTDPGIPPCSGSATAAQVRVYPPGETQSASVAAPSGLQVCSSHDTSAYLSSTVAPVSATAI